MANIKFGTDGWRAIVGKDFNEKNVETVTKAIAKYIIENFKEKKILIGYDPRNKADDFANQSANILKDLGFEVLLSEKIVPTPVLAYGAKNLNTCAIMFTASHNPPEYLGMKFIPNYAGPATKEITDALTNNLNANVEKTSTGKIILYDFLPEYQKHIEKLIDFEKIKTLNSKILYNGLYSASIGYFDKILQDNGIEIETMNMFRDVNFAGGMPDPKPEYLKDLIEKIKQSKETTIGVSNDGDGDRFGIINENGEFVTANEIISILLLYLKENKKLEGSLVKTVAGSLLLNKIAEKTNTEVIETAVGFKHVGEAMRKFNPIIGGEESGGLSIQNHIPEKDGIIADLLVLEAMAVKEKSLVELQKEVETLANAKYLNERIDLKLESQEQVKTALEKMNSFEKIAEFKVIKKDAKDGIKIYLEDEQSWILVRASGTEPLLRIYFETDKEEKMTLLQKDVLNLIK